MHQQMQLKWLIFSFRFFLSYEEFLNGFSAYVLYKEDGFVAHCDNHCIIW